MTRNGFTDDVITLCLMNEQGRSLLRSGYSMIEKGGGTKEDQATCLRAALLESLAEPMKKSPLFVQQIVARALLDHVDWEQVVAVTATDETLN